MFAVHNCTEWLCMLQQPDFLLLELGGPNIFQHGNAPVLKVSFVKAWLAKVVVEEHKWSTAQPSPPVNNIKMIWNNECDPGFIQHRCPT